MKFTICGSEQGTDKWKADRLGRVTGSRAIDIVRRVNNGKAYSADREDYLIELACERLTGEPSDEIYITRWVKDGKENEPFARALYEANTGIYVRQTGFLSVDELMIGCSLDGDTNDFEGIQEFKCPKTKNHYRWMKEGVVPPEHMPQIIHNLWVTGAKWCDFVSYSPKMPEHLQLFIVRVPVENIDISAYEKEVFQFMRELDKTVNDMSNQTHRAA